MEHELRFDGNAKGIAWELVGDRSSRQYRRHADIYFEKVTDEQSRYIALHVGIFWCIGAFRIRNADLVNVMIPSKKMLDHLRNGTESNDSFAAARTKFIEQLARRRSLIVRYHPAPPGSAAGLLREQQTL